MVRSRSSREISSARSMGSTGLRRYPSNPDYEDARDFLPLGHLLGRDHELLPILDPLQRVVGPAESVDFPQGGLVGQSSGERIRYPFGVLFLNARELGVETLSGEPGAKPWSRSRAAR